jgi:hypothetical protein
VAGGAEASTSPSILGASTADFLVSLVDWVTPARVTLDR